MLDKMGNRRVLRKKTKKKEKENRAPSAAGLGYDLTKVHLIRRRRREASGEATTKVAALPTYAGKDPPLPRPPPPVGSLSSRALIAFNAPYLTQSPGSVRRPKEREDKEIPPEGARR